MENFEAVKGILKELDSPSPIHWSDGYLEAYAQQICDLFEPKHLGKAEFKTAFADEVIEG